MDIRIYGIVNDSIVDGPGFRLGIFTQGCPHGCPGCHNPDTHDPHGGSVYTTDSIIAMMEANPLLDGITLSGGEPFMQIEPCTELAKAAHAHGLSVWCYTGYLYEALIDMPQAQALLNEIDVLVDGPFILALRSLDLRFRGSSNQRVIDMNATRKSGDVTPLEGY